MNRRALLGIVLAAALLGGCSGGSPSSGGASSGTSSGGAASSSGQAAGSSERGTAVYSALPPEGSAETKAVENIGKSYDSYLKMSELNAKTNASIVVYKDGRTVKPLFIGYRITATSDKLPNGKYNMTNVLVLNGVVTSDASWEKAGELTKSDINPQYFVYQVPSLFSQPMKATTQRQKDAIAKAKAWLTTNFADKKLAHFELTSLVFTWGQPGERHGLLLDVNPDNNGVLGSLAK